MRERRVGRGPVRRKRRHSRRREIAASIGVVLVGAALVIGIVASDPRWHTIIATWGATAAAWFANVRLMVESAVEPGGESGLAPPRRLESQETVAPRPGGPPRAHSGPIPSNPARPEDSTRLGGRPSSVGLDNAHVMVNILIAQLGIDLAWRTAVSNADSHAPDSPEFAYWHRVADAIRDGGSRPRP